MQPTFDSMRAGADFQGEPAPASGSPSAAQVRQLVELLGAGASTPKSTAVVECPMSMVGRVIGKGGETIKALQQYTGAMIQIDQSCDPTRVTIAGMPQALQLAVAMVCDIVRGTFKGFAMLRQIATNSQNGVAYGQQHTPVYVQGYGFVPPSQAYTSGAGNASGPPTPDALDPLAALLVRTAAASGASAGPASLSSGTPPVSPLRSPDGMGALPDALIRNCSPDLATAAALLYHQAPAAQSGGDNAAALSQLLSRLSVGGGADGMAPGAPPRGCPSPPRRAAGQQPPSGYFGPPSGSVTPPGTPGAEQFGTSPPTGFGGVLDAAGVQTLLAQTAILSRNLRQQQQQQQQQQQGVAASNGFDPAILQSMLNLGLAPPMQSNGGGFPGLQQGFPAPLAGGHGSASASGSYPSSAGNLLSGVGGEATARSPPPASSSSELLKASSSADHLAGVGRTGSVTSGGHASPQRRPSTESLLSSVGCGVNGLDHASSSRSLCG